MQSKQLIETARLLVQLKTSIENIDYKLETNPTIQMSYENEDEMLVEDRATLSNFKNNLDEFLEYLELLDGCFLESEINPLTQEAITLLRSEGRLK